MTFRLTVYVDPACPWSWITARWLTDVATERDVELNWMSFSLWFRDEGKVSPGLPPALREIALQASKQSLRLMRIFEALRGAGRDEAIHDLYLAWGERVFVPGPPTAPDASLLNQALDACGLDESWAVHADDPRWDDAVEQSMKTVTALTGPVPAIPTIVVDRTPPVAFTGPVLSPAPDGARGLEIWDAVRTLLDESGFYGLSRSQQGAVPVFA